MLFLEVTGYGPNKLCENVTSWFVEKYLPRHKLSIWVNHRGLKREGIVGSCTVEDCDYRPREFKIEMQTQLPKSEYIKTLLHELQHVLQHVRGDLRDKRGIRCWKGIDCSELDYEDQPWEQEAYEKQEELYVDYNKFLYS